MNGKIVGRQKPVHSSASRGITKEQNIRSSEDQNFSNSPISISHLSSRNWKKFSENVSSLGVVRKNHLKPRSVRVAAVDSGLRNGLMPLSSKGGRLRHGAVVAADEGNNVLLRYEALGLGKAHIGFSLMVSNDDLDLGSLEVGKPLIFREGKIEIMFVVDYFLGKLDRISELLAGGGSRPGELMLP